jgi:signal transduction histidine kinase
VSETFENIRALFKNPSEVRPPLDVNEIVLDSLRLLDVELRAHKIVVNAELARDLPRIAGHGGQLQELFVNLFQNAIDAMDGNGVRARTLTVATQRRGDDELAISVEDSGCGIEPERLPNIFDAFTTTKPGGTGLGLGICRMIVDRHGGRLTASSKLGSGTRFAIALPLALARVGEAAGGPEQGPSKPKLEVDPVRARVGVGDARREAR